MRRLVIVLASAALPFLLLAGMATAHTHKYGSNFNHVYASPASGPPYTKIKPHVASSKPGCSQQRRVTLSKDGTQIDAGKTNDNGFVTFNGNFPGGHTYTLVATHKVLVNNAQHKHVCSRHAYSFAI